MRLSLITFSCLISFLLSGQEFTTANYYLFPINPGQQNLLAGTMGEIRSSHFHAGLDIKTGGVTGLPVHATADGYISRIKVDVGGYGQALYMTHPNGTTSVYAHLEKYQDMIQEFVIANQYQEESYTIQLFPDKDQFTFKQGEIIGYSGNTGSSSGPHLHFEIRDINQRILDPLKFEFAEIKDDLSPMFKSIAFVTLDGQARVNDTFGRHEFDVLKTGGQYGTRIPIELQGNIGIELYAYDLMNGVYNRNGIPTTTLVVDGDTVFQEDKISLSFGKQRNIVVHMDYEAYKQGRPKYNKLFVDDGNDNDFYTVPTRSVFFGPGPHQIKIFLKDSYGNISVFESTINQKKVVLKPSPKIDTFEVYRNHLHFKAAHNGAPILIKAYLGQAVREINPYRTDRKVAYYLWDLRNGLPDSIDFGGKTITTGIQAVIPSGQEQTFQHKDLQIQFRKSTLFDTLYLEYKKDHDPALDLELFTFPHDDIPLKSSARIWLKPSKTYDPSQTQVYSLSGGQLGYIGGTWTEEGVQFDTRDLGTFTLSSDLEPPVIKPVILNENKLYFNITDDLSGIKSYKATLNGQYLLMNYEYKKDLIWAVKKDPNILLNGELILLVEDNAGNQTIYQKTL